MIGPELSRRNVLRGLGAAAVLATGAGCGKGGGGSNTTANNRKVALPEYLRFDGVRPDLRGTGKGVPDGFLSFPTPKKGGAGKPGTGNTVTAITETGSIPPPLGRNKFWQSLNSRLGVNLKMNLVNEGEYPQKIVTVLAGGDLPDLVQLHPDTPHLPELLRAKFADLTEFLSGDAITEYPYLANIPPYAWPNAVYNGGIYGV
jgi:putative aldouronate transport system substrate-binding protein